MKLNRKIATAVAAAVVGVAALAGCSSNAEVASYNLSEAADNFEIDRRIVFLNIRTGKYEFMVEGKCSIHADTAANQLEVTCRIGPDEYVKHYQGQAADFTYFAEQLKPKDVSVYHHKITYKPEAILPEVSIQTGKQ